MYCLTPAEITIRNGHHEPPHSLSWANTVAVRARCWRDPGRSGPGPRQSGLTIQFDDGESIGVQVTNSRAILRRFDEIKEALRGKEFRYELDPSVTPYWCPDAIYPRLLNW